MPRNSTKSPVASLPYGKRVTRGSTGVISPSTFESPGGKLISEKSSAIGRSQRSNSAKSSVLSPAAKKTLSPSPKPSRSKRGSTPKKPAQRGRSSVRKGKLHSENESEEKVKKADVHKKGKKNVESPSPSKSGRNSKSKGQDKNMKVSSGSKTTQLSKSSSQIETETEQNPTSRKTSQRKSAPSYRNSLDLEKNNKSDRSDTTNIAVRAELEKTMPKAKPTSRKRKHEELETEQNELSDSQPDAKTQKITEEINSGVSDLKREETEKPSVAIEAVREEITEVIEEKEVVESDNVWPEIAAKDEVVASDTGDESDYEIISNNDVPPADSDDVIMAVEKSVPPPLPAAVDNTSSGASVVAADNGFSDSEVLFSREFVANQALVNKKSDPARSFSVVSYNILADVYAQKDFGGGKASWITDDQLAISSRHVKLMKELEFLDSDIVCFQEVQGSHWNDLLTPDMEAMGYKGLFIPRKIEDHCEGEATFYRSSRFSLVSSHNLVLGDAINEAVDATSMEDGLKEAVKETLKTFAVAMIARLKLVDSEDEVTVANIHVSWPSRPDRSSIQLAQTIQKLIEFAGGIEKSFVICGDFNSSPNEATYQFVSSGHLNSDSVKELQAIDAVEQLNIQKVAVVNVWPDGFQFPAGGDLRSSYFTVLGIEPMTSRFTRDGVRCVDYIWFSSVTLDVLGVLKVVDPALIEQGVPNDIFPSDHLSLKALLAFK